MEKTTLAKLSRFLVQHSVQVHLNDIVLIQGAPSAELLIDHLYTDVFKSGGRPLVRFQPGLSLDTTVRFLQGDLNPTSVKEGQPVNCSIGIGQYPLRKQPYTLPDNHHIESERLQQSRFLDQASKGAIRWVTTLMPSATQTGGRIPAPQLLEVISKASLLDQTSPDRCWQAIRHNQNELCQILQSGKQLQIRSANGTEISFQIAGRRWLNGICRYNVPDGEVFTAPVLKGTQGVWHASFPIDFLGNQISGARLVIDEGVIVHASAVTGEDALRNLVCQDAGSCLVGEIGLGTNPRVIHTTGIGLIDEKMAGTAHLGMGSSYPSTGGTVTSGIHLDLVCDLRNQGELLLDGKPLCNQIKSYPE